MTSAKDSRSKIYQQRRQHFSDHAEYLRKYNDMVGYLRLIMVIATIAAAYMGITQNIDAWLWAAAGFALLFTALVMIYINIKSKFERAKTLECINQEALNRLERNWSALPIPFVPPAHAASDLASNLDLFGKGSLIQLLGEAGSPSGHATLADWLLKPGDPVSIRARQAAVARLGGSAMLDFRQELMSTARLSPSSPDQTEALHAWSNIPVSEPQNKWLKLWSLGSGILTPVLLISYLAGWLGTAYFLPLIIVNVLISLFFLTPVHRKFNALSRADASIWRYAVLIQAMGQLPDDESLLVELKNTLVTAEKSAAVSLQQLSRIWSLSELRRSPTMYIALQALTLWDFHVDRLLRAWLHDNENKISDWVYAVGKVEALCVLAGLHFDNPEWVFPGIGKNKTDFIARSLGHPLLHDKLRISNDVHLGPPGHFLLITGSNMSGKSTLLRTIGINTVLAQAGGPVCAAAMTLPPVILGVSINVQDSLEQGASFFMAELQRLKSIFATADTAKAEGRTLLFLLDEILRGTNSEERRIAFENVMQRLLYRKAMGAVTTHDLALIEQLQQVSAFDIIHFRETIETYGEKTLMNFDYKIHPGPATTRNALKLIAAMGLDSPSKKIRGVQPSKVDNSNG